MSNPNDAGLPPLARGAAADGLPPEVWGDELEQSAGAPTSWVWDGYLAHGNVTLLTSQWKSGGKTTLLSILLARRKAGGLLAGRAVATGLTAVVSEESAVLWNERRGRLDFGPSAGFLCRPFGAKPTGAQWLALIDRFAELRIARGVDLAVIDPLAAFLPGRNETQAGGLLDVLLPLQRLTRQGMAVLLLHHPRKGATRDGQAARGSGALDGFVDISLEMHHFKRPSDEDRRRLLYGYSRFERTPRNHVIELNAEATDYRSLGTLLDLQLEGTWQRLHLIFSIARARMSQREVAGCLAEYGDPPAAVTLWRWLDRAVARGLLLRAGEGTRASPYRYCLPGMEEKWKADPQHEWHEARSLRAAAWDAQADDNAPPPGRV